MPTTTNIEIDVFEVFPWNTNFETGIALIDEQHKQLVALLNKLAAHLANRSHLVTLNEIFEELAAYTHYHFEAEEKIWQSYFAEDVWFENHQLTHHGFMDEINNLRIEQSQKDLDTVTGDILKFLTHWLAYHILDTDKRMSKVVFGLEHGLSLEQAKHKADTEMKGSMRVLIDTVLSMYDSLSARTLELMRERVERRRAEEALQVSEERWKFVLEGAGDGVWDWNIASGEVYHSSDSPSILKFLQDEESIESGAHIHPDDLLRLKNDLQAHLDGRRETFINEHRLIHKNGSWSWILTRGKVTSRDATGKPLRMIGTHFDITERELAMMVFQHSREAIIIADWQNQIVAVNPAFSNITGYSKDEVIGEHPEILSSNRHGADFYQSMWDEVNRTGCWQGEIWSRRKNGEVYPQWLVINCLFNPDSTIQHYVSHFFDISHEKLTEELIWKQANFDYLTGLPNRHLLHEHLRLEMKKADRSGFKMALMFIDLDNFREVNDTLGHVMGDILLKKIALRLVGCVRDMDIMTRLGGDEFAVIIPDQKNPSDVQQVAQKILKKLAEPFYLGGEVLYSSASIGITLFPDDGVEVTTLLKNADQAMYHAKSQGRNRFSYFTQEMQEAAKIRMRFANDLRNGLADNQFILYYQPIIDLQTGIIHKAEALLRWQHPIHGMVSPAAFISIAEETGVISELGDWVFYEAAKQAAAWRSQYSPNFQISINKSPIQFRSNLERGGNHKAWLKYLKALDLSGQAVVIEITEGLLMNIDTNITEQLLEFRDAGIQVALDDFGTGFSSLSYLNKLDIDYIKIDQSFVRNLESQTTELALCEAIIVMAHTLGIKVIAEGIETEIQRQLLMAGGCDYGQGFLFSKPVPAAIFEQLLINQQAMDI